MTKESLKNKFIESGFSVEESEKIIDIFNQQIKEQKEKRGKPENVKKQPVSYSPENLSIIVDKGTEAVKAIFQPTKAKMMFDTVMVLLVILPIFLLGLLDKLGETPLGTLFGGIIGYTLSRFKKGGQ